MDLSASVGVARPAGEVFAYISEPVNNPVWQKGMHRCEWLSDPPIAVGSQYRQEASFVGKAVVSVFEVVEYVPGISITFEAIQSTFPIRARRWVEDGGDGTCQVSALIEGGPSVPRFLEDTVGRIAQRLVRKDYKRLAATLQQ
jgi:hypothetical protein